MDVSSFISTSCNSSVPAKISQTVYRSATAPDVSVFEDQVARVKKEIVACTKETERLAGMLEELQARVDALAQAVGCSKPARFTVHNLPVEILLMVFRLHCTSEHQQTLPALRLGFVCSRWRRIVHSSPALWTTIPCRELLPLTRRFGYESYGKLVRFYLERSGSALIKASLGYPDSGTPIDPAGSFTAVTEQCHRWKSLSIEHHFPHHDNFPIDLPLVEEISLCVYTPQFALPSKIKTPALRSLRLAHAHDRLELGTRFDTSSLTHLSLYGNLHWPSLLGLLKRCPRLAFFKIDRPAPGALPEAPSKYEIASPLLRRSNRAVPIHDPIALAVVSLTFSNVSWGFCDSFSSLFLQHFTLPRLRNLHLSGTTATATMFPVNRITGPFPFLCTGAAPPPLTSLDLTRAHISNFCDIVHILTAFSGTLAHLNIIHCTFGKFIREEPGGECRFLQAMTLPNNLTLLPHLKELEMDYRDGPQLVAMVVSRYRVEESEERERLSRVHIRCHVPELQSVIREGLADLVKDGLRVQVTKG
ncbi:hypothetical protein V5O48_008856 [Marasmius crinis-equi]|uniref:F-box domain-containing protein n=1 Tax=Marasmius crinis-equi TaxID=585013 RepID=A0ABR3FCS0_9AGAR